MCNCCLVSKFFLVICDWSQSPSSHLARPSALYIEMNQCRWMKQNYACLNVTEILDLLIGETAVRYVLGLVSHKTHKHALHSSRGVYAHDVRFNYSETRHFYVEQLLV